MIEKIGDEVENNKRASSLSIESQFTSILVAIFAPILGLIADHYSISSMLMIVGVSMVVIYIIQINFNSSRKHKQTWTFGYVPAHLPVDGLPTYGYGQVTLIFLLNFYLSNDSNENGLLVWQINEQIYNR